MPTRIGLELDHDVNVALRPHVAGRRGAEQGQFSDPVPTAHFGKRWPIDLFVAELRRTTEPFHAARIGDEGFANLPECL